MTTRIKLRRDTAANWDSVNPVLALGEPGYDTTNNKLKIGDGTTVWQDLDYLTDQTGGGTFTGEISGLKLTGEIPTVVSLLGEPNVWNRPANDASVVADIDAGLSLKRPNSGGGMYNSYSNVETSWDSDVSPLGTEWNIDGWSDLSDVQTRTYTTFYNACDQDIGTNIVGREFVMHDTINDNYYKVEFLYWQPNGGSGSNQVVDNKSGVTMVYTQIDLSSVTYFVRPADDDTVGDAVGLGVTIKRGENGGLYNSEDDAEWDPDNTPSGTLWNAEHEWKDFSDITGLVWKPLFAAVHGHLGNNLVGKKLLMWDTVNDKYYTVKFTDWGQNNGGSFAYVRREILPTTGDYTGITFADGSYQDTALTLGDLKIDGNVVTNREQPGYGVQFESSVDNQYYWDTSWWTGTAEWVTNGSQGQIIFDVSNPTHADFTTFLGDLGRFSSRTISINGGDPIQITSYGYNNVWTLTPPATDPTTVNNVRFYVTYTSRLYFGGENTVGFFLDNQNDTFEVTSRDINLYADDDVRIRAKDYFELRNEGTNPNSSVRIITDGDNTSKTWEFKPDGSIQIPSLNVVPDEGGAVSTYPALQVGSLGSIVAITDVSYTTETRGGSAIRIVGQRGYGTWQTAGKAGDGTGIQIFAGAGGESSEENQGGTGGSILIKSGIGQAGYDGGGLDIAAGDSKYNAVPGTANEVSGGDVTITAGSAQTSNGIAADTGNGGDVTISAGFGNKSNGEIYLQTSSNGTSYDNQWHFASDGQTTLPGAVVKGTVAKTGVDAADIGKGEAATVTPSPSNNTNLNVGTVNGIAFGAGFTLDITVAANGDISAVVISSDPNLSVGGFGTLLGGGALGGTVGVDDVTFTIATLTNVIEKTPIDLTKSINKLTDGNYTLADGVEGQIMYLVPQTGITPNSVEVTVANYRVDGTAGTDGLLFPFRIFNDAIASYVDSHAFCTLIFTDGAWQQSGGSWD